MVSERVRNAVLGCNLKNDRMISVRFQSKPFNITVIQAYAPISNAEEAEFERFKRPPRPFRTNIPKRCPFHYRGLECKQWKQCQALFFGAPKSLQMVIVAMKLKDAWKESYDQPR